MAEDKVAWGGLRKAEGRMVGCEVTRDGITPIGLKWRRPQKRDLFVNGPNCEDG